MTRKSDIFLIKGIIIIILCFSVKLSHSQDQITVSSPIPSLLDVESHTSEGFLVTLSDGRVIHFFRYEPTDSSNHTGNNGRIVKRYSDDNGSNWSHIETIYDDEYDDRNIHGGLLENDRIILFFRRYDADSLQHIDVNYIYSDDGGETWSDKTVINTIGKSCGTHSINYVPGKGYMNAFIKRYYVELRFSEDGLNWDEIAYVWDYRTTHEYAIGETSFTYAGDGMIIGIIRDMSAEPGNYMQVISTDYGETWTSPRTTNIADPYFCVSPLNFYDEEKNTLISIASDRRGEYLWEYNNRDGEIWVYQNKPNEVIADPHDYTYVSSFKRPMNTSYRMYGYPCHTKLNDGNYLVMFSESYRRANFTENADLWQFKIEFESLSDETVSTNNESLIFPNPFTDRITIQSKSNTQENTRFELYDLYGKLVISEPVQSDQIIETSHLTAGIYVYKIISDSYSETGRVICNN